MFCNLWRILSALNLDVMNIRCGVWTWKSFLANILKVGKAGNISFFTVSEMIGQEASSKRKEWVEKFLPKGSTFLINIFLDSHSLDFDDAGMAWKGRDPIWLFLVAPFCVLFFAFWYFLSIFVCFLVPFGEVAHLWRDWKHLGKEWREEGDAICWQ